MNSKSKNIFYAKFLKRLCEFFGIGIYVARTRIIVLDAELSEEDAITAKVRETWSRKILSLWIPFQHVQTDWIGSPKTGWCFLDANGQPMTPHSTEIGDFESKLCNFITLKHPKTCLSRIFVLRTSEDI